MTPLSGNIKDGKKDLASNPISRHLFSLISFSSKTYKFLHREGGLGDKELRSQTV
jgi:hypothetical protein